MNALKRFFSFCWADIGGIFLGVILIVFESSFGSFFDVLMSYWLYLFIFLGAFIFNLWVWFLSYHGEFAYFKGIIKSVIKDYCSIMLATISTVGVYALIVSIY